MKQKLTCIAVIIFAFLSISQKCYTQSPSLNSLVNFVVFSTTGAITNTGFSQFNGDVGANVGAITGFGNVSGTVYSADATTAQAALDLTNLYNQLNTATPTFFPSATLGNGDVLTAGVYKISSVLAISGNLSFNAQGDPNALFIFQITGALNTGVATKIKLLNGAKASNIFWVPEGAVTIGTQSFMRGTILAHNGAVTMNASDTLEGRLFSTAGAINTQMVIFTNPPVPPNYIGTIGNYVWDDLNGDGIQNEAASAGKNGVTVYLYKDSAIGNYILFDSTITADNGSSNPGYYLFDSLASGRYMVIFPTSISGKILTYTNQTTLTDGNSDANARAGVSGIITLKTSGTIQQISDTTIDAGYVCPIITPTVTAQSTTSFCSGGSVVLSATSAGTYQWYLNDATIVGATNQTYTAIATGNYTVFETTGVCHSLMSDNEQVTVLATSTSTTNMSICSGSSYNFNGTNYTVAGTYTAHLTSANGCDSAATLYLTINALPTIAAIGGLSAICVGQTTTLTNTINGGLWKSVDTTLATINSGSGLLTGLIAGTSIIRYTVTNTNGCVDSVSITITVNPKPTVVSITGTTMVCVGSTITLIDATANGVWHSASISKATINTSGVVTGIASGTSNITYTVTNVNGCVDSANTSVTVTNCTSTFAVTSNTINASTPANTQLTGNASSQVAPTGGTQPYNYTGTTGSGAPSTNSKRGGSFSVDSTTGVYTYTPPVNYVGKDTFYITVCDDDAIPTPTCATVTYTVQVGTPLSVSSTPAYVSTNANTPVSNNASSTMGLSGGLQPYTYSVANAAGNATTASVKGGGVTINPTTCAYTYTPATNFSGADTFYIKVCDAATPTNCVQQMFVINVSGSVTGGGSGGTESKTLGDVIAVRLYGNAINSVSTTANAGVQFTNSGAIVNGTQDLSLNALIPATVANTDAAYVTTPTDLVNFTNAVEVLAVDYSKGNSTKAVAFGTKTLGDVYTHTKPICDRLKGAELMEVKTIKVNGFNLMAYKVHQRTGETEYAVNLSAGTAANRNSISLQSNWFTGSYQQDEKLYNFQLWAVSYEMVTSMATDIINKLQANGTVNTVTNADLPKAYVSKGNRKGTDLNVTLQNNTTNTTGYFELREKANENSQVSTRQIPFTVNANGTSNITIPVKDNYEANIYVYLNNKLTDLVYLADGTWSLDYNKQTTSISKFNVTNETSNNLTTNSSEHRLFRNISVTGTSKDYITVYKTMMGGGLEQNVSNYKSLLFNANASGAGSVTLTLVKKSITNWTEQYTYTLNLDGEKEYGINLSQFKSKSSSNAINANDIVAVNFSFATGRGTATTTINISLSKARFSTTNVATDISANAMNIYPNPSTGKFNVSFNSEVVQPLVLKVIEISTGKIVKTQFVNAAKGANQTAVQLDNITSTNGLYIVTLEGDNTKYNAAKLMVNKK